MSISSICPDNRTKRCQTDFNFAFHFYVFSSVYCKPDYLYLYTVSLYNIIIPNYNYNSRALNYEYLLCCPTPPTVMRAKSTCPRNSLQRAEIPILIQTIWLAPVGVNGWPFRNSNFPFGNRQTKTVIVRNINCA